MKATKKMTFGKNRDTDAVLQSIAVPVKRLQMNIPATLHNDFKVECVKAGLDMTDVVIEMVSAWVEKQKSK